MMTTRESDSAELRLARAFTNDEFDRAYNEVVIGNRFFEEPSYYRRARSRYRRTVEYLASLQLPRATQALEIGGGQIALLMSRLFDDRCTVADVSSDFADAVTRFDVEFVECDVLHDELPGKNRYDLVVLCGVVEHLPIPPHIVLPKLRKCIRPAGWLLVTTPNLYRLRNVIWPAAGLPVFCNFFYPERGNSLGHPIEYSAEHLAWQVTRAGYEVYLLDQVQLSNVGFSLKAKSARTLLSPFLTLIPRWRDNLVCAAMNPIST